MAAPGRAYWKGFLRLSLVSVGVAVYNAVDTAAEIKFNQIHKPSGKRINYTKTVKGLGPVDTADIVKAYEVDVIRASYQVRWFGDSLERTGATTVTLSASCTTTPNLTWGDPCATPVSIAMRKP